METRSGATGLRAGRAEQRGAAAPGRKRGSPGNSFVCRLYCVAERSVTESGVILVGPDGTVRSRRFAVREQHRCVGRLRLGGAVHLRHHGLDVA